MMSNTRRIEHDGEAYDVPVEIWSKCRSEAEVRVIRRHADLLVLKARAAGDPQAAADLLVTADTYEDRLRARLRLTPRRQDSL